MRTRRAGSIGWNVVVAVVFLLASFSLVAASENRTAVRSPLIDLHSHSTLSDGTDTPRQLVEKAHAKGIDMLAMTDHDQLQYDEETIRYAQSLGMTIIRGTELSCEWIFHYPHTKQVTRDGVSKVVPNKATKVHLLGYFTRQSPVSPLSTLLDELKPRRTQRNAIILRKLKEKFGFDITEQMVIDAGSRELAEKKKKDGDAAVVPAVFAEVKPQREGKVVTATLKNFKAEVQDQPELTVVEFFAPWCGHCKVFGPEYAKAAGLLGDVAAKLVAVDATVEKELAKQYDIKRFPTILVFRAGKKDSPPEPYEGGRKAADVVEYVKKLAPMREPAAGSPDQLSLEYFGRPHIAAAVIHAGYAKSISEVFAKYLSDEILQLEPWSLELKEAIQAIHQHGGVSVFAHPVTAGLPLDELERELTYLVKEEAAHLQGLEVYSSKQTLAESERLLQIATTLDLVPTGGSDYHGTNKDNVPLGQFGKGSEVDAVSGLWRWLNEKSLERLKQRRGPEAIQAEKDHAARVKREQSLVERAAIASSMKAHASPKEVLGSVESILSLLSQLLVYALSIAVLLIGVRLYEKPFSATEGGFVAALARGVKSSRLAEWLFGSSHSEFAAHAKSKASPSINYRNSPPGGNKSIIVAVGGSPGGSQPSSPGPTSPNDLATSPATAQRLLARQLLHPESQQVLVTSSPSSPIVMPSSTPVLLPHLPAARTTKEFIWCFVGLQVSYLSWGYLQERIMTIEYSHGAAEGAAGEKFIHSEFLVLMNRIFGGLIALVAALVRSRNTSAAATIVLNGGSGNSCTEQLSSVVAGVRVAPPYKYALCSISNVLSSWFQYEALKYVSFPLQVLSKSSKILFTMLAGKIVDRKVYATKEYTVAALIAVGLVLFRIGEHSGATEHVTAKNVLASSAAKMTGLTSLEQELLASAAGQVSPAFLQGLGLLLLLGYIFADSFTSTWQGRIFTQHRVSSLEMMIGVNLFSSLISIVVMIAFDKLLPAIAFAVEHPICLVHACLMSLFSAGGQLFIFHTIATFGAVTFASIMTARQLFSLVLSLVAFGHHVDLIGYAGLALVFLSLGIKIVEDMRKTRVDRTQHPHGDETPAGKPEVKGEQQGVQLTEIVKM